MIDRPPVRPHARPTAAAFGAYWRSFSAFAGGRLWLAVAMLILIGLLEGSGIAMLLPLLHVLGLGGAGQNHGFAATALSILRSGSGTSALLRVLVIMVAIKSAQSALRAYSNTLSFHLETDFVCFLRDRFYRAIVQAGWLAITRLRSSDLTQALLAELPWVGLATRQLLMLLSQSLVALAQITIAFALSPRMTAVALGAGAIVGLGLRRFRHRSFALGEVGQSQRKEMAAAITEHLAGLKIVKGHAREGLHFEHFRRAMDAIADNAMKLQRVGALTGIWLQVGAAVALGLFVWLAVGVWHTNPAHLLILVFVFTRLLSQVTQLQNQWHAIVQALPAFIATEELRAGLDAAAEPARPAVAARVILSDALRVENVTFTYDPAKSPVALRGVDLEIPARQVTAFCGASGAGKSTLADIILGLLTPTRGRVLLDGGSLDGPRLHEWRQSIGYVPQETFLFHETVRTNLLWARADATDADLREALDAAAARGFVERLPQGLDTLVGDRGVRLSGGERQRIALARALLRRPTLLVLDEATSSLDSQNERLVQDAIERLHGELTIVVIAHRLSTVRFADRIVVLDAGRIVETGTWHELAGRAGGAFQQLVAAAT